MARVSSSSRAFQLRNGAFTNQPSGTWGWEPTLAILSPKNRHGHVLGHVKDLGDDPTQIDKIRIYRTNARQFFHADDSDIVGLLCIARALEGGESDLCSAHAVYNTLQKERPDVLKTLIEPIWYFDRKGGKVTLDKRIGFEPPYSTLRTEQILACIASGIRTMCEA